MKKALIRLANYLNPMERLGKKEYSIFFPLLFTLGLTVFIEILFYTILNNNQSLLGIVAIFVYVSLIIYFSFRDGIRGGFIVAGLTIAYYLYIIQSRHYTGAQYTSGIETTFVLGAVYFLLAGIIGWLKQTLDILIEREANEKRRLRAIIQQLPVGVVVTDNKGRVAQVNKRVDEILGVKVPIGYVVGNDRPLVRNKLSGNGTFSKSLLVQTLTTGKAFIDREYLIERPDKKEVHLLISTAPIHNRAGKVIAAAQIMNDITQQKEMEARKDDFVNMASHELKTPLTSMKLYLDLLMRRLDTSSDKRVVKSIQSIQSQTEKLQELVNDLLDVSRLQTGKLTFTKEEFILNDLVTETVDGLQGAAQQKIIISQKNPIKVNADRFRIYQVLTNLITNAAKYSPPTEKILIDLKRKDGKAIVSVQDYGIGIVKDQQKKIFDRLYQVTDQKEKTFPGLGMGLYISKEIIKRHKGTIWVESEKGKGSTFFFSFPLGQR